MARAEGGSEVECVSKCQLEPMAKTGKEKGSPLGFWGRKLLEAGNNHTPFEKQLLACYWALVETEQLTIEHEVALHPEILIMQ